MLVPTPRRVLGVPLVWFPRLTHPSTVQRHLRRGSPSGQRLHWGAVPGLLAERDDTTIRNEAVAQYTGIVGTRPRSRCGAGATAAARWLCLSDRGASCGIPLRSRGCP